MISRYSQNGVAQPGTPLARLCDAIPRDEASDVASVYVGDLHDVLESVGLQETIPELADKPAGDKHQIATASLRSVIELATGQTQPESPPSVPTGPDEIPLKEQVRRGRVGSDSRHDKK